MEEAQFNHMEVDVQCTVEPQKVSATIKAEDMVNRIKQFNPTVRWEFVKRLLESYDEESVLGMHQQTEHEAIELLVDKMGLFVKVKSKHS
jgi:hypothetical protein